MLIELDPTEMTIILQALKTAPLIGDYETMKLGISIIDKIEGKFVEAITPEEEKEE